MGGQSRFNRRQWRAAFPRIICRLRPGSRADSYVPMAGLILPRHTDMRPITSLATSTRLATKSRPLSPPTASSSLTPKAMWAQMAKKSSTTPSPWALLKPSSLGFTGRRTDHLLGNLSLLKTFADRLALRIVDDYCDIRLIDRRIRFRAAIGQKISLCPLDGAVEGITTEGLKWSLRSESLVPGVREGISNEVVDNPGQNSGGTRGSAVVRAAGGGVRQDCRRVIIFVL